MDNIPQVDPLPLRHQERTSWTAVHVATLLVVGAGLVLFLAVFAMLLVTGF
jgi:hypothetical protein